MRIRVDRNKEYKQCRCCGVALLTIAEDRLGVHISCVAERNLKERTTTKFPRPMYGRRNTNDEGE